MGYKNLKLIKRKFTNQPKNSVVSDHTICYHFNCKSGGISPLNSGDVPDFPKQHLGTPYLLEIVPWYPKSASKYSIMGLGSISSSSCRGKRVCRACLVSRWMMQDPQEEDDFALVVPLTPLGTDLLCSVRMIRIFSPHLLDTCMNEEIDK